MSGGVAIWIAFMIVRAILASGKQGSTTAQPAPKPVMEHPWYVGVLWVATVLLLIAALIAGAVDEFTSLWLRYLWALPTALLLGLLFSDLVTRSLVVPLGEPRFAYFMGTLSMFGGQYDLRGRAALGAAFAVLAQRRRSSKAIGWIEERMKRDTPTRGAGLVAIGVLALARGDRDEARRLLEGIREVDPRVMPPRAAKLAADWLAADAASRGEWRKVRWIATRGWHRKSRRTEFLGRAASAILRLPDAPWRFTLVVLWLVTPSRMRMWSLLRRALAPVAAAPAPSEPRRPEEAPAAAETPPPRPLDRALLAHETLLRTPRPRRGALRAAGAAWRGALRRRETLRWAMERATALEASSGEAVLRAMERSVGDDLAAILRRSGSGFMALTRADGPLGVAARQVRDEVLSELELACQVISARAEQKRPLAPADEWREWQSLRDTAERAFRTGGRPFQRMAFPAFERSITSLACWLYNIRHERALANAMFRWLHVQACAVEDAEAKTLQLRNMNCAP